MEKLADLSINEAAFFVLYEFLPDRNVIKIAQNVVLELTFTYAACIVSCPCFRHRLRGADDPDNDDSYSRAESLWYMQCAVNDESFFCHEINGINRSDAFTADASALIGRVKFVFVRS